MQDDESLHNIPYKTLIMSTFVYGTDMIGDTDRFGPKRSLFGVFNGVGGVYGRV
ncbi:MAG: hypothetical protein JRI72_00470 [Deltaproteobacteria bacterium]|nr:hypothetical protein [Deltaproteobacteria bacterium]